MACEYEKQCQNNTKCFRCYNQSLLKMKHEKKKSAYRASTQKDLMKEDSWKNLEQDVANKINNIPTNVQIKALKV